MVLVKCSTFQTKQIIEVNLKEDRNEEEVL